MLGGWSGHCKLVHFTTRLRGAAYSFYRSCSLEQRSDYTLLAEELKKRFTPVKLAAVQSQLFLDRKQGPKESVDEFAQDLKKLAYAGVNRGGPEAEKMGQSVLANQFIAGLRSDLKSKVVGVEGSLEQLLLKARFEEAKKRELRELSLRTLPPPQQKLHMSGSGSTPRTTPATKTTKNPPWRAPPANVGTSRTCFNCGMTGHLAQACTYPRQSRKEREPHGRKEPATANVRTGEDENWKRGYWS